MTKQEQFFYDNAGFSYDPKTETKEQGKIRCAKAMAIAETSARADGFYFEWTDEGASECIGCDCGSDDCDCCTGADHECFAVLMYSNDGKVVASLGSVCKPTRDYRRVIEAELALEHVGVAA